MSAAKERALCLAMAQRWAEYDVESLAEALFQTRRAWRAQRSLAFKKLRAEREQLQAEFQQLSASFISSQNEQAALRAEHERLRVAAREYREYWLRLYPDDSDAGGYRIGELVNP